MRIRKNKLVILAVLLLTASISFAQDFEYVKERELAQAVFKSLQNKDLKTFKTYCINDGRMAKMLDAFDETVEKDKSIKGELSEVPATEMSNEAIDGFQNALELAKTEKIDLKKGEYPELAYYKTRFETAKVKCVKVKFRIELEKDYMVIVDMFKTNEDIFIYDFKMIEGGVY